MNNKVDDSWKTNLSFVLKIYREQMEEWVTKIDGKTRVLDDQDIKHALIALFDKLSTLYRLTEALYYLTENIPTEED
tara:strand:+ start:16 stop:246 length:231 start_codon:yes stop_codon:yes gene_type:complete